MRTALAGMLAMAAAMGIGRFVYTPLLPGMAAALDLTAADAGLLASANYGGYLVGAVLAAGAWGQGRERVTALLALLASAVLAGAMALDSGLSAMLAIRFFAGVASAFAMVFTSTIVLARIAAAGRPGLQAVHFGGVGVGIAVSASMVLVLHAAGADWRAGWVGAGILSLAALALVALLLEAPVRYGLGARREPPAPRSTALVRLVLAYGLFGFGYIVTATFLVAIVRQQGGSPTYEATVWLWTGLAVIPSVWLWSLAARRFGLAAAFSAGCVVEAVGVVASVTVPAPAGPLIGGILLGATFIAVTSLGIQIGRQLAGSAPRRVLAVMTAVFGIGQIAGPLVAGVLADRTGSFLHASALAAAVLAVAGLVALRTDRLPP